MTQVLRRHVIDSAMVVLLLVVVDVGLVRARAFLIGLPLATALFLVMRLLVDDPDRRPRPVDILLIGATVTISAGVVGLAKAHAPLGVNVATVLAGAAVCHAVRLWRHEGSPR